MSQFWKALKIPGSQAHRLADIYGVQCDLYWVIHVSHLTAQRMSGATVWREDFEISALQGGLLVRYARCYKSGVRDAFRIPTKWLEDLSPAMKETHAMCIDLRDKHIAHSVNDWERNIPVAEMKPTHEGGYELVDVNVQHDYVVGMTVQQIINIGDLARHLSTLLDAEYQAEKRIVRDYVTSLGEDVLLQQPDVSALFSAGTGDRGVRRER